MRVSALNILNAACTDIQEVLILYALCLRNQNGDIESQYMYNIKVSLNLFHEIEMAKVGFLRYSYIYRKQICVS